ncbi:XTP/dITP diphosphatase [Liquorilactobacillus vini]|uniref:XTP/dITP diphosphatase n=1 Tax=Liquorilactobacillus vini TaxID=238015 RepID=UPI00029A943B|nr:XTP/dITP diphosphatase [Liquorilactobacillus vini]
MKKILIATKNPGKAREFRSFFEPRGFKIITLNDLENPPQIIENGRSFTENALIKANALTKKLQTTTLADDSGLMVSALNGEPGVFSARYAADHDDAANNQKLLNKLVNVPNEKRDAIFHTTLVVTSPNHQPLIVEGEVKGYILQQPAGHDGFGYDPLFYLPQFYKTFAQMSVAEKNQVSHRGQAIKRLAEKFDDWWE